MNNLYNRLKQNNLVQRLTSHPHFIKYEKWVLLLIWAGIIFYLSSNSLAFTASASIWVFILRKIAHMFEFGMLAFLAFRAIRLAEKRHVYWDLFFAFILAFGYAVFDEYHQTFTAGRVGIYTDVMIDTAGIIIATWLMYIHYHHAPQQLKRKKK